ncbi:MAG: adenosylcobinamide-GDP ribazoletransferase [Acidimicrobiales bacterium]
MGLWLKMGEALAFLTCVGGARRPSRVALRWFPVVGVLLGLALGLLWREASIVWAPGVAAVLVLAGDLVLTGMLHLDGLVDAADGLLPHMTRERRLAVMRQPDAGAFGIGVAGVALLAQWAALSSLRPSPLLLGGLWCLSRAAMAATAVAVPYARSEGGIASAFRGDDTGAELRRTVSTRSVMVSAGVAVLGAVALASWWSVPAGPAAVGVALVTFGAVLVLALRRVGGFTGDVLGAAGMVAQSVGLIVAAARW